MVKITVCLEDGSIFYIGLLFRRLCTTLASKVESFELVIDAVVISQSQQGSKESDHTFHSHCGRQIDYFKCIVSENIIAVLNVTMLRIKIDNCSTKVVIE